VKKDFDASKTGMDWGAVDFGAKFAEKNKNIVVKKTIIKAESFSENPRLKDPV
jgi:ubiquitin C-terminal hydrolase